MTWCHGKDTNDRWRIPTVLSVTNTGQKRNKQSVFCVSRNRIMLFPQSGAIITHLHLHEGVFENTNFVTQSIFIVLHIRFGVTFT